MTPSITINEMLYIVTAVTSLAAVLFLILWRIDHREMIDAGAEIERAAKVSDSLNAELKRANNEIASLTIQIRNEKTWYDIAVSDVRALKQTLSTALIRNSKGQLVRADGKPTDPKRVARRAREKANRLKGMTDLMLQASVSSVAAENVEQKRHQLKHYMQVKGLTRDQKRQIHEACLENRVAVEDIRELVRIDAPWIWFINGRVGSALAIYTGRDINITFDEFMARIKGEWVEPTSNQ